MDNNKEDFNIRQAGHNRIYRSGKVYNHSVGLSCCFRQWRAESHCRFLHGYSLKVDVTFKTTVLDERNWAVDFGSLKSFKGWLEDTLDHKTLVAADDPEFHTFQELNERGLIQMIIIPASGCEGTARLIYEYLETWLVDNGYSPRVMLETVKVSEHEGNWASYGD